jgi:hypothetical protein
MGSGKKYGATRFNCNSADINTIIEFPKFYADEPMDFYLLYPFANLKGPSNFNSFYKYIFSSYFSIVVRKIEIFPIF